MGQFGFHIKDNKLAQLRMKAGYGNISKVLNYLIDGYLIGDDEVKSEEVKKIDKNLQNLESEEKIIVLKRLKVLKEKQKRVADEIKLKKMFSRNIEKDAREKLRDVILD